MPAAARITDTTSHTRLPPPTGVLLAPVPPPPRLMSVFIAGRPAVVLASVHQCAIHPQLGPLNRVMPLPRPRQVFVGGAPLACVGDLTTCGATILTGAPNVIIGERP
ncbi:PAAR domain-containing protein [Actinokineospora auranticolor]|uniref:PAAR motif-containing protein n=1 Tax=Actinokineospora auranticolor TaxID=155976 RepID=A0A2S6GT75_9PSEU|nr:PAAR domain-containing protein [Actinokineospora auranticolor]PPK68458.1 PAAR motif-containing protein [Actinokineospora auranticolor]